MNQEREQWIREHPAYALDTLSRRLERAAKAIPEVVEHLIEQRAAISLLNAQALDASQTHSGAIPNPTLQLVERYDQFNNRLDAILDGIITAWVCVDMLDTDSRKALGMRAPVHFDTTDTDPDYRPAPRCIGDNTADGAVCWNIPSPRRDAGGTVVDDGRCLECGPRHDRFKMLAEQARRIRRQQSKLGENP